MSYKFQLTGLEQVDEWLTALPPKIAKQVMRRALRQALKPVLTAVKAAVPVDTGALRDSIKIKAGKRKQGYINLLVQMGEGNYVGKSFYGAFSELGYYRGGVLYPGTHAMEHAWNATANTARQTCIDQIKQGIDDLD